MSEISKRYAAIADGFGRRVANVTPEQWLAPTPCTEWTVRDLVTHVVDTHQRVVGMVDGSVDTTGELADQWDGARAAVSEALDDPERAAHVVSGQFGEQPFEMLVSRLLCADTLTHTWDLARGTGQDETLDPQAVAKAMEFLGPLDEAIRRPGGFAPKIEVGADADPQTAYLGFCGRSA